MAGAFDDLYQEVILDHYRKPRNRGAMANPDRSVSLNNPLCGDVISVDLKLADGKVADIRFHGQGCSISQSSASMMTTLIKGKSLPEATELAVAFKAMLRGDRSFDVDGERFGDLVALQGVMKFPARIKCATLAWNSLVLALEGKSGPASTTEA